MTDSPRWFKSSYSNNGGNCVEVATARGEVLIRDSKDPSGPRLSFTGEVFGDLVDLVKRRD
ncbi:MULTISPECIES: DUF397 domain-containing protein [unclassified Streptomyces]|uniref:DUF397 domain-containing protein n=1 Tax=unclassified Streptomyces TaxID=2593676 RepID=UPI0006AF2A87|nr:DUF397 domain-containing protein [Streptomyces sp. WM4235]